MRLGRSIAYVATLLVASSAIVAPTRAAQEPTPELRRASGIVGRTQLVRTPSGIGCERLTVDEAASLSKRGGPAVPLHVIKGARFDKTATGLTIVLRATNQLESFPDAKNAFIRAAAEWESLIANPITIILDVDFGPKRFGENYPPLVIGSTDAQDLIGDGIYGSVRSRLVSGASSPAETTLYNSLPSSTVPTDIGGVTAVGAASANFRALGLISATANPDTETNFGDPPSIGFNSEFDYDFNPSNGIDFNKTDFNAVVLHELGHVLGFESNVGVKELDSSADDAVTVLDIFRFRPGISSGSFGSASRVLSSGGTQVYFGGGSTLELSTGRPNGRGGDGQQASHWKDDVQTGTFVGLMDPTIADGQREDITANDLEAIDRMGYRLAGQSPVTVSNLAADLDGDTLTITGTGASTAGAITSAQVALLDGNGSTVRTFSAVTLSIGTSGNFTLQYSGLSDQPSALTARVVLKDNTGIESAGAIADFSGAETGAPEANNNKIKVKPAKIKIPGTGFNIQMMLELNGVVSTLPPGSKVNFTGTKVTLKQSSLALRSGPNRIRFILNGRHSNIVIVSG